VKATSTGAPPGAPRLAMLFATGVVFGIGASLSSARGAQDVSELGKRLEQSKSSSERRRLLRELGKAGDAAALGHLIPALGDEKFGVRRSALSAIMSVLQAAGGNDPARLLVDEALSVKLSPTGQLEVVALLDKLSPPKQAAGAIIRFVKRGDLAENVARQCINTVRTSRYAGLDVVRDGLLEQVEKGDVTVAAAAASALTRMDLSEREKAEVVETLVGQLGLEGESAPIREAATKALEVVTGEDKKSTHEWRAWAVKEGYNDPVERIPEDDIEAERLPVIVPPVDTGASPAVSSLIYVVVGLAAAALVVALLVARSTLIKRSAAAIEARRQKARRSF